jgi:hypothetical protein
MTYRQAWARHNRLDKLEIDFESFGRSAQQVDSSKESVKYAPKQVPRPNQCRNDKPPKKQEQVSLEGTAPRKCSQFAKDILIERDRKSYAEITNG